MEGRKGAQALLFGDKLGFLRQIGFSREDITQPICGVGMTNPGSFQKDAHAVRLRAKAGAAGVGLWAAARPVPPEPLRALFCSRGARPGQTPSWSAGTWLWGRDGASLGVADGAGSVG